MHITFLNPQGNFDPNDSYWAEHPDFGGQLVYVKEVAAELSRLGHRVDIITRQIIDPDWPEFSEALDSYPGFPALRIIRIPCGPKKFLAKEQLWPYLATEWVPGIIDHYAGEQQPPDIFTAHYGDGGLATAVLRKETHIPFTFTGHSLGAQKMDKLNVHKGNLADFEKRFQFTSRIAAEKVSINHAARIITSTSQERDQQYRHPAYRDAISPGDSDKFSVIPPGVNIRIFSQTRSTLDDTISARIGKFIHQMLPAGRAEFPFILSASRLDPKKNISGLVRAFARNSELQKCSNIMLAVRAPVENFSQAEFFSDRENPVLVEINALIQEAQLEDKILVVPLNSQAELAAAYRTLAERKSVFILPALHEPFGLAPLEAMSCGLPAVVTKNGGPAESMVEGSREFGVLIDPEDPDHIAAGILRLFSSRAEWDKFHTAGIRRVQDQYTWQQTARGYADVFEEILRSVRLPDPDPLINIPDYFFSPVPKNQLSPESLTWLMQ